jgi:hypothetical protein
MSDCNYARWNETAFGIVVLHAAGLLSASDGKRESAYRQLSEFVEWLRREDNRSCAQILRTRSMEDIERIYGVVTDKRREKVDEKEFMEILRK